MHPGQGSVDSVTGPGQGNDVLNPEGAAVLRRGGRRGTGDARRRGATTLVGGCGTGCSPAHSAAGAAGDDRGDNADWGDSGV